MSTAINFSAISPDQTANPQPFVTKPLYSAKIDVWFAFSAKIIIPPVVIGSGTLDGDRYLDIVRNHPVPYLKSHHLCSKTIYQHDGAPPHIKGEVQRFLKNTFGEERLISCFNLHAWPQRSPELYQVDFWLLVGCIYGFTLKNCNKRFLDGFSHKNI